MSESLSILCFGNSLTAGFHCYGLKYHPYAAKLEESIKTVFPNIEVTIDVDGLPGDLVITPPGAFLSRIQKKAAQKQYDWIIFLGGTNDLGYGNAPDKIYAALQLSWDVALASGANVIGLTIPECAAKSESLDNRRNELNRLILDHKADRFYTFDLKSKIPYHSASAKFQEEIFDDGLHLTTKGYDLMGTVIGEHLVTLLRSSAPSASPIAKE